MADNTRIQMVVRGASVVTVPIDDTLAIAGQAADAKAVGDALADKVDAESIMESVQITWNGVQSDNQGIILADADDLPVDGNDSVKDVLDAHGEAIDELGEAIEGLSGTVDDAVLVTAQELTDAQKTQARTNIGAVAGGDTVLVAAQELTEAQQAQVRENIGAVGASGVSDVIRHSAQTLTAAQQEQARANIGAGDAARVTVVNISNLAGLPQTITDARITADMVVVRSVLSNPAAQLCDWTVTAANGSLVIAKAGTATGIGYGGTDLTLYLEKTGSSTPQVSVIKTGFHTPLSGEYYRHTYTQADEDSIFANIVTVGRIMVYKIGTSIYIRLQDFAFGSTLTAGQTYTIATLPENARSVMVQDGQFISASGAYHGRISIASGNGNVNITPFGTDIPAGTTIGLQMPYFTIARDYNDLDLTGFEYVTTT